MDAIKHGFRARDIAESQVLRQNAAVQFWFYAGVGQESLDLRGKNKGSILMDTVVKGLDAQPIACREKPAAAGVPEHKRKHAAQAVYTLVTKLLIEVKDGLRVAARAILMSLRFEISAQFLVVVDFAVINNPDGALFIADRLMPALHINDAKPPHSQADILGDVTAIVIRTAVGNAPIHSHQHGSIDLPGAIEMKNSRNSAHT